MRTLWTRERRAPTSSSSRRWRICRKCARRSLRRASTAICPVLCSMTFEENGRTFAGCDPLCYAMTCAPLADAVGVNCSLGPAKTSARRAGDPLGDRQTRDRPGERGTARRRPQLRRERGRICKSVPHLSGRRRADHRRVLRHDARVHPPAARPCRRACSAKEKRPPAAPACVRQRAPCLWTACA